MAKTDKSKINSEKNIAPEPLFFEPILQKKLWGGSRLSSLLNKNGKQTQEKIGESWELSDNSAEVSIIANGPYKGQSFREIFKTYKDSILGFELSFHLSSELQTKDELSYFPLLYKFIDANDNLSVQVHPQSSSSLGQAKTECWYVIEAVPNAKLIVGISSHAKPDEILESLKSAKATTVLNQIDVKAGDLLFIPAGTVHAITKGLLVYEVQQNSDTTFRLYDWDRVEENGMPRQLHLSEAAQCIDYTPGLKYKVDPLTLNLEHYSISYLVANSFFALYLYFNLKRPVRLSLQNRFLVLTCISGSFDIEIKNKTWKLKVGQTALIPANCEIITLKDSEKFSKLIASNMPDLQKDIVAPLLDFGIDGERIKALEGAIGDVLGNNFGRH